MKPILHKEPLPMKFLLDENIGKEILEFLEQLGHSASRIRVIQPGLTDSQVLNLAVSQNSILITSDKDFGELIFKYGQLSSGVILLRLKDETSKNKIKALKKVLTGRKQIKGFTVVIERAGEFIVRRRVNPVQED